MADLLTISKLAIWTQNDIGEVQADPRAADLIETVSAMACLIGGHDGTKLDADGEIIPEWSLDGLDDTELVPRDVALVVLQVCKRSYENPGRVLQEGSIGPLGGDRVADAQALFMEFSEAERLTIARYNVDGDETAGGPELVVISTTRGEETTLPPQTIYVGDDQQVGLASSIDPREWMIPMFNPNDPGSV